MILSLISGALGAHLVIVDGSKNETEATGKLERWAYADWPRSTVAPSLLDSSTVEGLNPGFHILVFGHFEHAEDAKAWSAYLNAFGQKSYVREIAGGGTDQRLEVETSLTVTFADGERRLPLPAVEVRSCQTGAVMGESPTLPDGTVQFAVSDGVDLCLFPSLPKAFVEAHGLEGCTDKGVSVTCTSKRTRPPQGFRAIVITPTPHGAQTGEDWGWFTHDVSELAKPVGIPVVAPQTLVVDIPADGRPVARIPIQHSEMLGYWFVMDGKAPEFHVHDMPDSVWSAAESYFGL